MSVFAGGSFAALPKFPEALTLASSHPGACSSVTMRPAILSPVLRVIGLAAIVGLAGCATELTYNATLSDGQRMTFRLVNGLLQHGKSGGLETGPVLIEPNMADHKIYYKLRLFDRSGGPPPRSIRVEDVSEEAAHVLVEDAKPEIKGQEWTGVSAQFAFADPELKWVGYLDESFRVFRFTVVRADGTTVVLHEPLMVPAFFKTMLRHALGEKY